MSIVDKLYTEWAWRTKSGTPDYNNPEDKLILDNLLVELGVVFEDEEGNEVEADQATELTSKEKNQLINAVKSIKDDYVKYLTVFSYFDNNSLGTISEVLLTKLLNRAGIEARHTGASGELADLYINNKPVSLKTTAGDKAIGLGSDEVKSNPTTSKQVVKALQKVDMTNVKNVYDLKGVMEESDYNLLVERINVIADKLAGPDNKEFFIWVEKVFQKGILTRMIIHVHDYDLNTTKKELMSYKPYFTEKAWGLRDSNNRVMIGADTSGKLHNVQPAFVRKATKDSAQTIDLVNDVEGLDKASVSNTITDKLLSQLDSIYSSVFASKE